MSDLRVLGLPFCNRFFGEKAVELTPALPTINLTGPEGESLEGELRRAREAAFGALKWPWDYVVYALPPDDVGNVRFRVDVVPVGKGRPHAPLTVAELEARAHGGG